MIREAAQIWRQILSLCFVKNPSGARIGWLAAKSTCLTMSNGLPIFLEAASGSTNDNCGGNYRWVN